MSENEAWIADCHILGIEGDEEFRCQAAVWANSASEFRAQLDRKLKGQGFKTLWLEECLKAPEYVRRHGHQQKIGALARAVHPGHLVELSKVVAADDGAEVEPESYLIIEEIEGVEPLDQQFGIHPKKTVPDVLREPLFGQPKPTEAEIEHYAGLENVPPMKTYAILDAAKVLHLPTYLRMSELKHRCLFKGDAADELNNVAPYLVELEDDNTFTHNLFTSAGMPSNMWDREPGIYVRSRAKFDDIWKHFRKFTRVKDENNKWFMFRFWENAVVRTYFSGIIDNKLTVRRWFDLREGEALYSILAFDPNFSAGVVLFSCLGADAFSERPTFFQFTQHDFDLIKGSRHEYDLNKICDLLLETYPNHCQNMTREQILSFVRSVTSILKGYGIRQKKNIFRALSWELSLEAIFSSEIVSPAHKKILQSNKHEDDKMEELLRYLQKPPT